MFLCSNFKFKMFQGLDQFMLSGIDWVLISLSAILIGMSKTGVPGVSIIVVPVLAMIFGGKLSTGILLPILILADIFGVFYYNRHVVWKHLFRALPWAFGGLLLALWVGNLVNDEQFKSIIALSIFFSIGLLLWRDKSSKSEGSLPHNWWFAAIMGVTGGFATMIGNVAGPVFAIYLLSLNLPKNNFIGTTAWFFAIINIIKLPLQILVWQNITIHSLLIDFLVFPFIGFGAWLGIKMVKAIPENNYRWLVIVITITSALLILL